MRAASALALSPALPPSLPVSHASTTGRATFAAHQGSSAAACSEAEIVPSARGRAPGARPQVRSGPKYEAKACRVLGSRAARSQRRQNTAGAQLRRVFAKYCESGGVSGALRGSSGASVLYSTIVLSRGLAFSEKTLRTERTLASHRYTPWSQLSSKAPLESSGRQLSNGALLKS